MSTVKAGDVIAVYRGGKLHNAPADMSTVQDTDLIVVGRGNVPYKCTVADWRASQSKAPVIHDVLLADSPEAGRFTSGTFASTVDMTEEGVPAATKGIKAWVEGSLKTAAVSSAITAVNQATLPTSEIFSTTVYAGNGGTQTITNGIDLAGKGGLVWIKSRTAANNHALYDTVRGATKGLHANETAATFTQPQALTGFNSDGWDMGADGVVNASPQNYASWTFRKAAKFFDVVTYAGNGTTQEINHSLGSTPGCIIIKRTDSAAGWYVWHRGDGSTFYTVFLNDTDPSFASAYNDGGSILASAPTSTSFTVKNPAHDSHATNGSGGAYVAYLFAHDPSGIIQCGSYTGGAAVNLGWQPQWVLTKRVSENSKWEIFDSKRASKALAPNSSNSEDGATQVTGLTATGFTTIGFGTYIHVAIRSDGSVHGDSELTFGDSTNLASFVAGDAVTEVLAAGGAGDAAGSVKSVDAANSKMTVNTSAGTWDVGNKVKGPLKTVQVTPTSDEIVAVGGTGSAGGEGTPSLTQYSTDGAASTNAQNAFVYGKAIQDANNNANHTLFQWAAGLTIAGHSDWYIPAKNELEILYRNLKPGLQKNSTHSGENPNSVPPVHHYIAEDASRHRVNDPQQTTATLFRSGAPEAFSVADHVYYISASEASPSSNCWAQKFDDGEQRPNAKMHDNFARAIRRVAYTGSEPAIGEPYEGGYFAGLISTAGNGVADYALIVGPNAAASYKYAASKSADPYVLTFKTDKDLANFAAGDAINQNDSAASGTVASVDSTAKTMTLATSTGTWGPANAGKTVVGVAKPGAKTKLFCTLDASLNVTDLQSPDPGFTAVTGAGPYSVKFPATLPSGNPPDTDLPAGTTLTTQVQASNSSGTSDKTSTPITPA